MMMIAIGIVNYKVGTKRLMQYKVRNIRLFQYKVETIRIIIIISLTSIFFQD